MKILPVLLTYCCLALLTLSLFACSSRNTNVAFHHADTSDSARLADDEEVSASEPEESAGEELEALKGLSAEQKMTLEQAGIDPTKYDFPIVLNDQVQYYLDLFQGKQRRYYSHWLARSTVYRSHIETELKKAGLPRDLVFLAMIESGYNPSAYSPANACGLWQFIAGTGRSYGLKINSWVDERREPKKATQAAISYLAKLHKQFDDWYLAVAAYNTGEGRIADAVETCDTKDFWEIAESESLYLETKRYVPKLIAAIIIGRDPKKYGFTDIEYQSPQGYEQIAVPGGTALEAVAATANVTVKELRNLNNELRKNQTPPDTHYVLHVPTGTKGLIAANLNNLKPVTRTVYTTHTVKWGDTLSAICKRYDVSMTNLLKANNLRRAQLKSGQRLQIPTTNTQYLLAGQKTPNRPVQMAKTIRRATPEVAATKVSKTSPVPTPKQIPVLVATRKQSVQSKHLAGTAAAKSSPSQKSLATVAIAKAPNQPTWYVVRHGDTLGTIARKFNTSLQMLRKWNRLSDNTLQTGNKLLVKKG